ncbi:MULTISPECIES: hypothetical protein [unclassified Paenibacillus]|nr:MULTISPECIES: hypothetical protein [unclassified Paenibacillus]
MTFRFNDREQQEQREKREPQQEKKEQSKVIPLHVEERRVMEEPLEQAAGIEKEKKKRIEVKPLNDYTTDFGGWQSSFDTETYRMEETIPASDRTNSMKVDPETGYLELDRKRGRKTNREYSAYKTKESVYYPNSSGGGSWMKITASVAGAVVTGVAFGFLVLSMFSGEVTDGGKVQPVVGITAQVQEEASVQAGNSGEAKASGGSTNAGVTSLAVNLPARTYTFLQGGVFSSSQSAATAVADFRKKGLAAASEAGEKYPVFVGMASSRDEALGLTREFQQRQMEVMIKSYDIPAVSQIKWNGNQSDLFQSYMSQGEKLVQQISAQTLLHLGEENPTALDEKSLQAIKSTHQTWSGTASAVSDGLEEAGRTTLPRMNSALNTAVVSLDEYKKNPSHALLWEAQTALMQYLVAEKELLKSASVQ